MAEKAPSIPPYGVVIQRAIASGDLAEMKRAAQQAEEHLRQTGDVRSALENLKIEIAKLEHK
jgi:primosomal protein N'